MSLSACPSCGFNKKAGLLTGAYFDIYRCSHCSRQYCYQCQGSNSGRKCPDCASTSRNRIDKVYLR